MLSRKLIGRCRGFVRSNRLMQIGLLLAFWWLGDAVARATALPVPGGVIGMALVLVLLSTQRLSIRSLRRGADWFLGEMLLFFVPAVLAVLDHREFLGVLGLKILAVIVVGTTVVMAVTAVTVDVCYRWRTQS